MLNLHCAPLLRVALLWAFALMAGLGAWPVQAREAGMPATHSAMAQAGPEHMDRAAAHGDAAAGAHECCEASEPMSGTHRGADATCCMGSLCAMPCHVMALTTLAPPLWPHLAAVQAGRQAMNLKICKADVAVPPPRRLG